MQRIAAIDWVVFSLYLCALGVASVHLYRTPIYAMDAVQYMGNALLMEDTDIVSVHQRVYAELNRWVPEGARRGLLGNQPGAPQDQNDSRRERARSPQHYAQFLPLFAIRPLYNQSLWLVSKTGMGLVRSAILISVASYFAIGILLLVWLVRYAGAWFGSGMALLLMISPPLTELGRELTSDAEASLIVFASLYLMFERRRLASGLTLLLASLFFRTDFVVLAGPTILVCWLERRIDFWKAIVLSLLAVGSVFAINHFAGDYGIKMLYYRNFIGVPVAPAEMTVQFSFHDYLSAFWSGITLAANSFFIPFLLLGLVGMIEKEMRALFAVMLAYVILHFVVLPNWQERWVALFYLVCGICAATAVKRQGRTSP
jgi:hypothetical protein